jgi:hypothetical protein
LRTQVVKLVEHYRKAIVLAIGDGANDVSMIQVRGTDSKQTGTMPVLRRPPRSQRVKRCMEKPCPSMYAMRCAPITALIGGLKYPCSVMPTEA